LTTFFVPALIADRQRDVDVRCVVTDSDINRVWAPMHPATTRIRYFAPSTRVVRRLIAYGVPRARITLTGFPLPHELVGGQSLATAKANLLRRLARLDVDGIFRRRFGDEVERTLGPLPPADGPPRVAFAVGGAGAQAELADRFLPSLAPVLRAGQLRLLLIAGVRREVADRFRRAVDNAGLGAHDSAVEILHTPDLPRYFRAFNRALADTDALWTKPSELAFFAALGLGLVLAPAVGEHERLNARWAMEHGAGLRQHQPEGAAHWLADWLADGTLAQAAWSGFRSLPKHGLYEIAATFSSTGEPSQ
jgi:UDP-N-acetylglucosamine:LPS N-acetylglucosamine transferase